HKIELRPGLIPAATEQEAREQLAALYRLYVYFGWTDLIFTHASARAPERPECYLIKADEMMLDEVCASNLIMVDMEGNLVAGDYPPNQAGHLIHTAVLKARPEINFVAHTHSRAGAAVSCMRGGLLPLSQHANIILPTVTYHHYRDVTSAASECEMLARDLGSHHLMILHNHGLLSAGRTVAECFYYLYYLEMACKIQVDVLASGQKPILAEKDIVDGLFHDRGMPEQQPGGARCWISAVRMLERQGIEFRD
ncbi:MAG: class II aldolase/adducin family protein, partial [bacterium]